MKNGRSSLLGAAATTIAFGLHIGAVSASDSIPQLVAKTKPATIQIVAFDENWSTIRTGTGFFISPDGLAVTNFHVIQGASHPSGRTNEGAVFKFERVVAHPPGVDLAILKFEADGVACLHLGRSTDAVEGQTVLVIGSPEGLQGTVTEGIISAFRENRSMIQISAPISAGSSGSPVMNESGDVIGVATLVTREGQNLGFAIAVEEVGRALTAPRVITEVPSVPPPESTQPSSNGSIVKWSDGRTLIHPEHSVRAYVIKVKSNDTLILRNGPGTQSDLVTAIPRNGTDLIVFNQDPVWDGDTWWYPVQWEGFRGYVGRSHLSTQ